MHVIQMNETKKINVLFICNLNLMRSPTAELIFKEYENLNTKSAGIFQDADVRITGNLLDWADIIMVMEERQMEFLRKNFPQQYEIKKLACLDIPDDFSFMSPLLIEILIERVPPLLKQLM